MTPNEIAFIGLLLAAAGTGALLARASARVRARRLVEWMRRVRAGQAGDPPPGGLLSTVAAETAVLARELARARETAHQEARLRDLGDSLWTPERLREHVRAKLFGRPLLVVSHREPYRHVRRGGGVAAETPASGLVTGLEPLLRACGGTWVAHGDGDADRESSDARGRVAVPPGAPQYTLRRVWLTAEQEERHYAGFSNEGLWPLCHIAHVRPVFRAEDWAGYREVNELFAEAVLEEICGQEEPCVLVQDYHFALMPALIKAKRPDARVALFWHIPWPAAESFGICPWQKELLSGMLGADVIGFHTQANCNNYLDTVDRFLETRIDRERFAVKKGSRTTLVKPFPISVAFPDPLRGDPAEAVREARARVRALSGVAPEHIAVGVDRLDYTKGILERMRGVERLLEVHPELRGRFTLFQIGAPSRTALAGYREFAAQVAAETKRVNERFAGAGAPPIILLARHHEQSELKPYFLAADVCLVTSLHDGMNLVAKEFVASREDDGGVLVLSRFTGAARELRDALIVNPYSADEVAGALAAALSMPAETRALRMSRLRRQVRENNVYRWAANLISDLASVRLPAAR